MNEFDNTYEKSLEILRELVTKEGFLASQSNKDNYKRIFSRDGVIIGLASLLTDDEVLINCFKNTLQTLKKYQGEEGEISSNVSITENKVSYGGTTGRVDATLWYIIGISQYYKKTKNKSFLKKMYPSLKNCIRVLDSWEFNEKNFIYVPIGGDWADEYINEGYVLYDEVLYFQALKEYEFILKELDINSDKIKIIKEKKNTLRNMIKVNFWPQKENNDSKFIYHNGLYSRLLQRKESRFFIPSFSPGGYKNNYDAFGNSLCLIFNFTSKDQSKSIFSFINDKFGDKTKYLIPAFSPVIKPKDKDWNVLQSNYSFKFKNDPHQYHNGGLWPLVTGFTISAMCKHNKKAMAEKYLKGMINAVKKDEWSFSEYYDGKTFEPKGAKHLGFSASSYVIAYHSLINNKKVFI